MNDWRCERTGNPVGTDTVMIGEPACMCRGCRGAKLEAENAKLLERLHNSFEERAKRALGDPRVGVSLTTLGELASRPHGVTMKGGETA